ncbi:MAG: T9SS type A sorting domain-containing protein, partial [bacterium]
FSGGTSDQGSSEAARNLVWMYNSTPYVGAAILDPPRSTSAVNLSLIDHALYVYPYGGLPDNIQIQFMDGTIQNPSSNRAYDWSLCASAGPFTIAPGAAEVAAFAILGGDNLNDLQVNTDTAYNRYWNWPGVEEEGGLASLPLKTLLGVMYPNPFKQVTVIRYQIAELDKAKDISLKVYDAAGRLVRTIIQGACEPGCYTQVWDARDDLDRRVPAGVYFVRFETDDYQKTEKAVLLK